VLRSFILLLEFGLDLVYRPCYLMCIVGQLLLVDTCQTSWYSMLQLLSSYEVKYGILVVKNSVKIAQCSFWCIIGINDLFDECFFVCAIVSPSTWIHICIHSISVYFLGARIGCQSFKILNFSHNFVEAMDMLMVVLQYLWSSRARQTLVQHVYTDLAIIIGQVRVWFLVFLFVEHFF